MQTLERPRPQGVVGKSPFRYPGGKAFLLPEIYAAIQSCNNPIVSYAEPYAGGAGAALELLALNAVEQIWLNDADPRISAAWYAILNESERFVDAIRDVRLTIQEWQKMSTLVANPTTAKDRFELGFATFFMNRTNRSGIIVGAGPIGGYEQSGEWKLDARFYRETMCARVEWIARHRDRITISEMDGVKFIRSFPAAKARQTFFFIDPPYVGAGKRLYLNSMTEEKHRQLAAAIKRKRSVENWLMTYDDDDLITEIYDFADITRFDIHYSLQNKRTSQELMITRTGS